MSLKLKITFDQNRVGQVDKIPLDDSDNSCEDNDEENVQISDPNSNLKRKRPCRQADVAYTFERIFESYQEATQYLDTMGIWKFERNRPTKKGSKGFYHCNVSDECKSKIYLLMDPLDSRVALYKNNVDHVHTYDSKLKKEPVASASGLEVVNNEFDKEESLPVEIVNDDDFEDSLVDFFDENYENKTSKFF